MHLYLREDLIKGSFSSGEWTPPGASDPGKTGPMTSVGGAASAPSTPSVPGAPGESGSNMQPCSVGGRTGRCEELGGPPGGADNHAAGSQFEIEHSRMMASEGAGAPQEETAQPGDVSSPEEAKEAADDSAHARANLSGNETKGVTSINPEDYPEDSNPMDHYKVAAALEASGEGNDSSKELAEGHRNIARQRAEAMSTEEHEDMAQQLHAAGLSSDAEHHEKTAGEARAKEKEAQQAEFKSAVDPEFDKLLDQFDDKQAAGAAAKQALKDYKAKLESEDKADKEKAGAGAREALEAHKAKWSEEGYEKHKSDKADHEEEMFQHGQKKPAGKFDYASSEGAKEEPNIDDKKYEGESGAKQYAKDKNAYEGHKKKAEQKHKAEQAKWQKKQEEHQKKKAGFAYADKQHKEAQKERDTAAKEEEKKAKEEEKAAKTKEKEEAAAAKEKAKADAEKPQPPQNDMDHARVASHREQAHKAAANMQAWLDHLDTNSDMTNEEKDQLRSKIKMTMKGLKAHQDLQHVPTNDHKTSLKELIQLAGEHGKNPPEEPELAEGTDPKEQKSKGSKTNLLSTFESGRRFGSKIGRAAATGEMAGVIGSDILNYGGKGVVAAGEHLLNKPRQAAKEAGQEDDKQSAAVAELMGKDPAQRPPTLGEQTELDNEMTAKSLYLDLNASLDLLKAVQTPNTAVSTPTDKTAKRALKTSYASQPTGVMGGAGLAMHDDPDVGAKWKHSPEDSIEEEIEEDREAEAAENKDVQKSMLVDSPTIGMDMIRDLNKSLGAELSAVRYNPREVEFMSDVLGATHSDIKKGLVQITGRDRHRFHEWLIDRMSKSVSVMGGQLV